MVSLVCLDEGFVDWEKKNLMVHGEWLELFCFVEIDALVL